MTMSKRAGGKVIKPIAHDVDKQIKSKSENLEIAQRDKTSLSAYVSISNADEETAKSLQSLYIKHELEYCLDLG